ncbi:glycosyltransferase family 2 protein [Mycobacterium sp. ACS1612]|uniref:glycosyltransferase family 2 protein n=1 Tax=Mycobacterium sp. ACS1612 TaxID=1834117 RepID=UPI0018D2EC1A|nr:glycosyltransferase family 2 protein [Mycobacterium sp. ACS1612]
MPLVSVVVIFLNAGGFLEEAVQSIRGQTLSDWELILVDDGSTDRSTSIARSLATEDDRIRYIDHPGHQNRGMSASRNFGVAHTTAQYISFLDADDVWEPETLAERVNILENMPDVALVCGALRYWHSWDAASTMEDRIVLTGGLAERRLDPPEAALALYPLGRGATAGVDMMVRRSAYEAVGGFEERFRGRYEDQAFLIKIFMRYSIYVSSRPWYRYRQHDASCSGQLSPSDWSTRRRIFLDYLQELEDSGRIDDRRVSAAVRRARRALPYQQLASRLFYRLPPRVRWYVHGLRWPTSRAPATHEAK